MQNNAKGQIVSNEKKPKRTGRQGRPRSETVGLIAEMMKRGLNYDQISAALNITRKSLTNWTAQAKRIAFPPQLETAAEKKPEPVKRRIGPPDALPIGHSVPTDALWRGLERWRPTTGLHAPGRDA